MTELEQGDWAADGREHPDAAMYADDGYDEPDRAVSSDAEPSAGELEWEERAALRRVTGLSTELSDVTEVDVRRLRLECVVLVGVWTEGTVAQSEASLAELARLAETAGSRVADGMVQRRSKPDPATYIGAGKVRELHGVVAATGADTVVFDGELAPSQLRNLESHLNVKVIDRTALILDIFAQHARSKEGKAQVELAQLQYLIPRLRGWGDSLSRQAGGRAGGGNGGVGLRGPGETKLETDRRRINKRITKLRKEIGAMGTVRDTKRDQRVANAVPGVAVVGYTNAGKSSLLNAITGAGLLVDDSLFATLDPTTRRAVTPDGRRYTITDTVGFVRHLPHQLVEAFRSTLEEAADADLLVHVVDGSDPVPEKQVSAVHEVFAEISDGRSATLPAELLVINKVDAADSATLARLRHLFPQARLVSARDGAGVGELVAEIARSLPSPDILIDTIVPYTRGELVARVHENGQILNEEHLANGTRLRARVSRDLAAALQSCDAAAV